MRYEYRVTKYNPKFRDRRGVYTRDEWTFFAQVGRRVAGKTFTMGQYLETEASYLRVLEEMLREAGISHLNIRRFARVKEERVGIPLALRFARSCLREEGKGGKLVAPRRAHVEFGWDYYMYVGLSRETPKAIQSAMKLGIFVEPIKRSPYR